MYEILNSLKFHTSVKHNYSVNYWIYDWRDNEEDPKHIRKKKFTNIQE